MTDDAITFDRPMIERLRKAYDKARTAGLDQFTFEGHDYVVAYARYLLEYLDGEIQK